MNRGEAQAKSTLPGIVHRAAGFVLHVLRDFQRKKGLLLAGAVAYYTLLSIVPLFAIILVGLSHFIDQEMLIQTIVRNLELLTPGYAASLGNQVRGFLAKRHLVGALGFLFMLFFSSMAFSVLESAMAVIFSHRRRAMRRPFFISAIIPYLFILLIGVGFFLVTLISGALDALESKHLVLLGYDLSLQGSSKVLIYIMGMGGMVLMLSALYLVMPVGRISFRHALSGAVTATVLWEVIRRILVWYYAKLSLVNVIYGSIATTVVALLSIEVAVIILLLGAQVISEFDRRQFEKIGPPGGGGTETEGKIP
jgi:YihY family inner membrane protein